MKRVIFTAIITLLSCVAFGQTYNIKFEVKQENEMSMYREFEYEFKDCYTMRNCVVLFDGKILRMTTGTSDLFNKEVISIKKIEKTEEIYGNKVVTEEHLILGTNGENCIEYFILKKDNLQKGGHMFTIYWPFVFDGFISSYKIYRSGKIE